MIRVVLHNGEVLEQAENAAEALAMAPEAKLRKLFAGDTLGMIAFAERLRDLDERYSAWLALQPSRVFWRKHRWLIYVLAWLSVPLPRESRP